MLRERALPLALITVVLAFPAKGPREERSKPKPSKQVTARARAPVSTEAQWVKRWMSGMSVRDLAAQLVIIKSYGEAPGSRSKQFREYVHAVRDLRVGGIIVINRVVNGSVRNAEPHAMAAFLNRLQKMAKVPLIAAADFERGASMRVADTIKYPHLMAYGASGDLALTRALGLATAREARALGIHWVFAPVADVNNNPDNPIINIRSFGEDPKKVAEQVTAFIGGAHSESRNRVLVTAKHFPGHGDTTVDSHMGLANLSADRTRMEEVELAPFRAAIKAGVDAVMTAHMSVPAIEKEEIPATVSPAVLTGLLRRDLAFKGIIVTDAMDMMGLTNQFASGEASVRALQAGADVLLMPPDPDEAIKAVLAAVKEKRLTRKQLEASVAKLLSAKYRVGLHRSRYVNLETLSDELESEEALELAQKAADRAVTLVRNNASVVPIRDHSSTCVYVLTERRNAQQGRQFLQDLNKRAKEIRTTVFDPLSSLRDMEEAAARNSDCRVNVVSAFVSVSAYKGNTALAGAYPEFVQTLLEKPAPVVLVALGSPYLVRSYPAVAGYLTTYSPAPTAETAAVKVLLGEVAPLGKLPVTIPDVAKLGEGIELRGQ